MEFIENLWKTEARHEKNHCYPGIISGFCLFLDTILQAIEASYLACNYAYAGNISAHRHNYMHCHNTLADCYSDSVRHADSRAVTDADCYNERVQYTDRTGFTDSDRRNDSVRHADSHAITDADYRNDSIQHADRTGFTDADRYNKRICHADRTGFTDIDCHNIRYPDTDYYANFQHNADIYHDSPARQHMDAGGLRRGIQPEVGTYERGI
jgi:hypothetical protein